MMGLTVASPLHQCFVDNDGEGGQADLSQSEFSLAPLIREWFWQTRASHAQLHNADNPTVREWYTLRKLASSQVTKLE